MLATALWIAGILFGAGGGLWIAALFVPTIATLLKSALDFARSPLGTVLAIAALIFFVFSSAWIGGDMHGAGEVRAAWKADTAARAAAEAKREADLHNEMARVAGNAGALDLTFSHSIDEKVKTYVAQTSDVACRRATRRDIERLLSIE